MSWRALVGTLVVSTAVGCGSGGKQLDVVPVSGKITYKGQPVDKAIVTFTTEASPRTAVGTTDAQGDFKLTTINTNDGAVAGEHLITIAKMPDPSASGSVQQINSPEDYVKIMEKQGPRNTQPPGKAANDKSIPAKYSNPTQSGLKRTVVKGEQNSFTIDLTD